MSKGGKQYDLRGNGRDRRPIVLAEKAQIDPRKAVGSLDSSELEGQLFRLSQNRVRLPDAGQAESEISLDDEIDIRRAAGIKLPRALRALFVTNDVGEFPNAIRLRVAQIVVKKNGVGFEGAIRLELAYP